MFKLFSVYKVNTPHAIVVNYIVACACGLSFYGGETTLLEIPDQTWFWFSAALGILFIVVFNLMAFTTQRSGLSVVSVATKMSVVIPILFGIFYYNESAGILKIIGILIALVAVYLASLKTKDGIQVKSENIIYPALVFVGSGIIDTSIKFLEGAYVAQDAVALFSATIFGAAGIVGIFTIVYQLVRGSFSFQFKNIIAGIALGIPNFFSIYFLVLALRVGTFDSSTFFTINNVAIVMASTFLGIICFRESVLRKNWIGIGLAVVSIILISAAS